MSRSQKILDAPKKIREKLKDFNEERKKPKEPITTKASMFSIVSWAFYDLGNTIFSGWHVGIEWGFWDGPETCSTALQSLNDHDNFLDEIKSTNNFIPCNEAAIRVLGISLAGYNSFISLIMFIYSISILRKEL